MKSSQGAAVAGSTSVRTEPWSTVTGAGRWTNSSQWVGSGVASVRVLNMFRVLRVGISLFREPCRL